MIEDMIDFGMFEEYEVYEEDFNDDEIVEGDYQRTYDFED